MESHSERIVALEAGQELSAAASVARPAFCPGGEPLFRRPRLDKAGKGSAICRYVSRFVSLYVRTALVILMLDT